MVYRIVRENKISTFEVMIPCGLINVKTFNSIYADEFLRKGKQHEQNKPMFQSKDYRCRKMIESPVSNAITAKVSLYWKSLHDWFSMSKTVMSVLSPHTSSPRAIQGKRFVYAVSGGWGCIAARKQSIQCLFFILSVPFIVSRNEKDCNSLGSGSCCIRRQLHHWQELKSLMEVVFCHVSCSYGS